MFVSMRKQFHNHEETHNQWNVSSIASAIRYIYDIKFGNVASAPRMRYHCANGLVVLCSHAS